MKNERKTLLEWQKKSSQMYAGFEALVVYDGEEFLIDIGLVDEAKKLGAKCVPFRLFP